MKGSSPHPVDEKRGEAERQANSLVAEEPAEAGARGSKNPASGLLFQ
ncbi:MAG: hypothetical protein AAB091_03955 [Elusimicrobiota bacterium]